MALFKKKYTGKRKTGELLWQISELKSCLNRHRVLLAAKLPASVFLLCGRKPGACFSLSVVFSLEFLRGVLLIELFVHSGLGPPPAVIFK